MTGVERSTTWSSRSFSMTISASTLSRSDWIPCSAWSERSLPSNANGRVTTPTVSAPISRPISATTGAPPVPVPPPSPAVTNTMSAPLSASLSSSRLSSAAARPTCRVGSGTETPCRPGADVDLLVGLRHEERLRVRVDGDELDAGETGLDHPRHRVRAAAADADDLDHGEIAAKLIAHVSTHLKVKFVLNVRPVARPSLPRVGLLRPVVNDSAASIIQAQVET